MANQALINAAQRMYSAKSAKAEKNIEPILKGVDDASSTIIAAVEEKRKDQKLRAEGILKPFQQIVLDNPNARPELTSRLEAMKNEYFDNIKKSERVFGNKKDKFDAVDANNNISVRLKEYKKDLEAVDLAVTEVSSPSDYNTLAESVNDVAFKDPNLAERLIYKDDGIYVKDHLGEENRLSSFKPLVQKNQTGIDEMIATKRVVVAAGGKNLSYEDEVLPDLRNNISKVMDSENWGSLLFDNIADFNWATQEMEARGLKDREAFKVMVQEDPETFKQEFMSDLERTYRDDFNEAKARAKAKAVLTEDDDEKSTTTFIRGQYIPNEDIYYNIKAAEALKSTPGRSNAIPIMGIPKMGTVWYDDKLDMYVYENIDSSKMSESEEGYKKTAQKSIKQIYSKASGGITNKFFAGNTGQKMEQDLNPNN